ncbi:linker for activation of T-cells family member 2-like [Elgaria multicarinata webbii]|uniref:linker for activation of T-cells family member 2-like n=1 Tax=Elgaria multicarinata webbii TaxID=159646 RepID=UPI002FCCFFE8
MPREPDSAYVEPIATNPYYNCRKFVRLSSDEDSPSYQNVAGPSGSRRCFFVDMDIYENSAEIQLWRESQVSDEDSHSYQNVAGPSGSRRCYNADDEPDCINAATDSRKHRGPHEKY